jgi:hypothetical protein
MQCNNTYFPTYSSAVQYALGEASKRFALDAEDIYREISLGGKPQEGTTKSVIIRLYHKQSNALQKRALSIQVFAMDCVKKETYELNWYIA